MLASKRSMFTPLRPPSTSALPRAARTCHTGIKLSLVQYASNVLNISHPVVDPHVHLGVGDRLARGDELLSRNTHFKVQIPQGAYWKRHRCAGS